VTTEEQLKVGIRALVAAVGQGPTNGRYLTRDEARFALDAIMDGEATPAQAGALLLLQRYRSEAPEELLNRIRALSPHIGARAELHGRPVTIWKARVAGGRLEPLEVQPDGKRRMTYDEFLRGVR